MGFMLNSVIQKYIKKFWFNLLWPSLGNLLQYLKTPIVQTVSYIDGSNKLTRINGVYHWQKSKRRYPDVCKHNADWQLPLTTDHFVFLFSMVYIVSSNVGGMLANRDRSGARFIFGFPSLLSYSQPRVLPDVLHVRSICTGIFSQ